MKCFKHENSDRWMDRTLPRDTVDKYVTVNLLEQQDKYVENIILLFISQVVLLE